MSKRNSNFIKELKKNAVRSALILPLAASTLSGCGNKEADKLQVIIATMNEEKSNDVLGISSDLFLKVQEYQSFLNRPDNEIPNSELTLYSSEIDADGNIKSGLAAETRYMCLQEVIANAVNEYWRKQNGIEDKSIKFVEPRDIQINKEEDHKNKEKDFYTISFYGRIQFSTAKGATHIIDENFKKDVEEYFKLLYFDANFSNINRESIIKNLRKSYNYLSQEMEKGLTISDDGRNIGYGESKELKYEINDMTGDVIYLLNEQNQAIGKIDVNDEMKKLGYVLEFKPDGEAYEVAKGKTEDLVDSRYVVTDASDITDYGEYPEL